MQEIRSNPVSPSTSLPHAERHTAWRTAILRILWCEPFWIALLAPSLLFPGRFWVAGLQPLWVLLLFAFWPLRLLAARLGGLRTFRASPLDLALAAEPQWGMRALIRQWYSVLKMQEKVAPRLAEVVALVVPALKEVRRLQASQTNLRT